MKQVIILTVLLIVAEVARAWDGAGTEDEPYLIRNSADWVTLADTLNSGKVDKESVLHLKLMGDITVSKPVGTEAHPFVGTFDGDGHTITANLVSSSAIMAPFAYVSSATIKHMNVVGSITGGLHSAGIVGAIKNSDGNRIEDCHVSADIMCNVTNDMVVAGGIVGHCRSSATTVSGCLFDGHIGTDRPVDFSYAGSIVGWCDSATRIIVENCIENADYSGWIKHAGMNYAYTGDGGSGSTIQSKNSYTLNHNWGEVKRACQVVNLSPDLALDFAPVATYPTTKIEASAVGLKLDGTFYVGSGETFHVTAPVPSGYSNIYCTMEDYERDGDKWSVKMAATDIYLSLTREWKGKGTEQEPYLIETAADWQQLALNVSYSQDLNYDGTYLLLTSDIDIYTPVGMAESGDGQESQYAFRGTFDGGGHTVTAHLAGGNFTAPFGKINNATIRHLHVAGFISGDIHTAGLAGKAYGSSLIEDCRVSATISGNASYAGGFVGHAFESEATICGSLFDGQLLVKGNSTYAGVFFGWSDSADGLKLENCIAQGWYQANNVDLCWKSKNGPSRTCGTIVNTYYKATDLYSISLGKRYLTITTSSPALNLNYDFPRYTYVTADIEDYEDGLALGGQRIAGKSETLIFGIIAADGFTATDIQVSSGTLTTMSNLHKLTLADKDVVVSATITITTDFEGDGTDESPYLVGTTADWLKLSVDVANGKDYVGRQLRMTKDIDAGSVMVGTTEKPFSGTFDGDNHTLTFHAGTEMSPAKEEQTAPFRLVSGATLRHLHTVGTIFTNAKFAAGVVGRVNPSSATYLNDCHSAVSIRSTISGDGTHGGLVGVVSQGVDSLVINRSTFKGNLMITGTGATTNCGGLVGWSYVPVHITDGVFDPQGWNYYRTILSGATFARMANYSQLTLSGCYATQQFKDQEQGTTVISELDMPNGCSYEFLDEPEVTIGGKAYYKSGCRVQTTVGEGIAFNHWVDNNGCFISDPWTANGQHQLKDLKGKPTLGIMTRDIPSAETERTLWGVTYRYLSRRDYHYYVSDEDCAARGWKFENGDSDANLVVYNGDGDASEITAITGYDERDYNSDGVQIHNDLVSDSRTYTHLGLIAPHAFRNSKGLKSLYFKDTDANVYNARTEFDFTIEQGAFEGCTNFKEMKMMQYTTRGDNHWEAVKPGQVRQVADDAFKGCSQLRISAHYSEYQNYLSSKTWKQHRRRFIIYEATTENFTVNGVKYHYYRDAQEEDELKNDESGKHEMMAKISSWNADYQQFNAADLLETNSDDNVWYVSIIGVDDSSIDGAGGVMRIYNDPGSNYNYKTINLQRDAIVGNSHVKYIEFWQTNGNGENSYSDLKMVIPNGALKGCQNLQELRLFYYVQDGDDRWTALGPKDVIPGDNIFGEPTGDEVMDMTHEEIKASLPPEEFRILVAPDLFDDFINDPNWQHYLEYLEPVDYSPSQKNDFTQDGLTYSYMTAPGGILQTSQVVSQDVSWWTVPRIGLEVLLWVAQIKSIYSAVSAANAAVTEAEATLDAAQATLQTATNNVATANAAVDDLTTLSNTIYATMKRGMKDRLMDALDDYTINDYLPMVKKLMPANYSKLTTMGFISKNNVWSATLETMDELSFDEINKAAFLLKEGLNKASIEYFSKLAEAKAAKEVAELTVRNLTTQLATEKVARTAAILKGIGALTAQSAAATTAAVISTKCWGGSGSYNGDLLQKGMRENILSNIHQVGLVGGGYIITTPQKNLVFHTYIKKVADSVTDATIYAGFDNDWNVNTSNRTMTFAPTAFRGNKKLKTVKFHDISNQSSNTGMPLLLTIPDSAFADCTNLTEFSTLLQTGKNGTRALGPENFILGGDSIFAGVDSTKFHIVIDPRRKQDFLDNASWKPLEKYFVYESAKPEPKYNEYGARYAYAYEMNSIKKEHKVSGHLIEHTIVVGPDDDFLRGHQGAVKLCNDIGRYYNYQLDEVTAEAFMGNKNLRSVTFTDLYGFGAFGDSYTGLQMHIGDRAFKDCTNLADLALLYMVTDGLNHLDPITPQQVSIGKEVFDGTTARIKMMPQQVSWFEADSSWAAYKDRFMPCVIRFSDPGIKSALKPMAFYDAANTGSDPSTWDDYCDFARIGGAGFSWLDGRFTAEKDDIHSFADFRWFESVGLDYVGASWFEGCSKLGNIMLPSTVTDIRSKAFKGCSALKEIELPQGVSKIGDEAFSGCTALNTIVVRDSVPATLGSGAFHKHSGLRIYVPVDKVSAYRSAWSDYAQYIVGDDTYKINKVVTVDAVGQLASKLDLTLEKKFSKVRFMAGPYAKYDSLTVIGPLNGEDLAVIRHMAGADAYDSDPTDGCLRYLNLWDAQLKKDEDNSYNGNYSDEYIKEDDMVPNYLFENCTAIETVILPQSATKIGENIFEDASGLKRVCVGRKTTEYDTDLLQNLQGIEELTFLTESMAKNSSMWNDPWEAPIQQVYALPSQIGDYMGDPKLTRQAQDIMSPFEEDAVMWALADKGYYFPSEYLLKENVEGIFNGNTALKTFDDFWMFQGVKALESAFAGNSSLTSITLPTALERIGTDAFSGCTSLDTIHISCDSVPELAADAFRSLPAGFQILVPKSLCKLYRTKWPQYAEHINPDAAAGSADGVITVTVDAPNTLAKALGLTTTITSSVGFGKDYVNSIRGDYSKIRRLKVIGPISGADLDVLRYLAGYCPWTMNRNYPGHLEYLDLYDAELKATDVAVSGYHRSSSSFMLDEEFCLWSVYRDNVLPHHAFLRAYNLKTLILPRTCTQVDERALQECEGLETLVVGDDMEEFDWNALDDDAMLTRMYLLAKKKVKITADFVIWRWLCNNYNPTFDAFYVRPSLYDDYLKDDAYTGKSWQRTNNVSKGAFSDDESFAVFASHAAATADDLSEVYSVDGWFDNHTAVRDLTPLGYTAIGKLRAADMQQLTQLEMVTLPVTVDSIESGVFSQSPNLRYADIIMCNDSLTAGIKTRGFADLGIDTLKTLVYLPQSYGEAAGTNVVVFNGTEFTAQKFRLVDGKDYCVPYAFKTTSIENSRTLPTVGGLYTVCLPYAVSTIPAGITAYQLSERTGDDLVFRSVTSMEALKPYLLKVNQADASLHVETAEAMTIPSSTGLAGEQDNTTGYALRGTLQTVDNKTLSDIKAYILQSDRLWHPVTTGHATANVPAFRAYLLQYGGNARNVSMTFVDEDDTTSLREMRNQESGARDDEWYTVDGRKLSKRPTAKGVYIHNGKKTIVR